MLSEMLQDNRGLLRPRTVYLETSMTLKTIPKEEGAATGHQGNSYLEVKELRLSRKPKLGLLWGGVLHDE